MEDFEESINESKEIKVQLIYSLNNGKKEEGNLKFSFDKDIKMITYGDIINSFYYFLLEKSDKEKGNPDLQYLDKKENNIIYLSIRYFDGYGWIILDEDGFIFIDEDLSLNNLKILIFAQILEEKKKNIKKKYDKIDLDISYIYRQITKEKEDDLSLPPDAPYNLVVLTANPLMDGEKQLRTVNDFNIITSKIYEAFDEKDFLKYTKFLPLTFNSLKNIITDEQKRPVILHLICKSTYIFPEFEKAKDDKISENSEDYTNLIFEDDDNNYYKAKFINKQKLENEIFNYNKKPKLKENVNKITLIISTPLATDVYNIFEKFGFKNILIQHTTLADVNFIADFNYTFYKDIITLPNLQINEIFINALDVEINDQNKPTFCCCFHKHKTKCDFFKNLKNELYNNIKCNTLKDFEKLIPHFYHLYPDCSSFSCKVTAKNLKLFKKYANIDLPINSFCSHFSECINKFKCLPKIDENNLNDINKKLNKKYRYLNFCCCGEEANIHNINYVFIKDFTEKNKNNKIRFRNGEMIRGNKLYIPNFEKMKSIIGNNEVIFNAIKFFSCENKNNLNIYGDNTANLKKFGEMIIEYYLERYYFFDSNDSKSKINKIKSAMNLNMNLTKNNSNNIIINEDSGFHSTKSAFIIEKIKKINFIKINLTENYEDITQEEDKINDSIYFIYVHDISKVGAIKIRNKKIIWFTEKKLENNNIKIDEFIEFNKEPTPHDYKYYMNPIKINLNAYIKFQYSKDAKNWRKLE